MQPGRNATECLSCVAGSFCEEGASWPQPCPAGTFSDATNLSAASKCTACPLGHFCPSESLAPIECNPGSYASEERLSLCPMCGAGTFQSDHGKSACEACSGGSLCPPGATLELPPNCPKGEHGNVTNASTGHVICYECAEGHSCAGGGVKPDRARLLWALIDTRIDSGTHS